MIDTNGYRSAIAFRLTQMTDPALGDTTKLHLADVLRGHGAMLCDEVDALRDALAAAEAENARLRAIIARIDKVAPRADDTCDEPGIKLSTAVRRTLRNEGHPLFRKEPPSPSPR